MLTGIVFQILLVCSQGNEQITFGPSSLLEWRVQSVGCQEDVDVHCADFTHNGRVFFLIDCVPELVAATSFEG